MKVESTVALALAAACCLEGATAFAPVSQTALARTKPAAAAASVAAALVRPAPRAVALYGKRSIVDELNGLEGEDDDSEAAAEDGAPKPAKKEKVKLEPEVTQFEGAPDISETFVPAVSVLTVIGIIPFAASLARQAWVRYTITSRRIRVVSGINGRDETEVVYPDIKRMVYVYRMFGRCGDVVMELRDGSKLELRSLPNFEENYNFILSRTTSACQEVSDTIKAKEPAA
ncbi:hypothetical protein JKP88DRAFT_187817 [Tribonema minus]|uniref:YdbS-like PH domain-containing protein n=1 Tax=Tribonema minus TaxID=303371 RepID=A0A836CBY9_9STRA|nr:hypothetical protein JKP88DRAFT_187817 [Tribonema minus]